MKDGYAQHVTEKAHKAGAIHNSSSACGSATAKDTCRSGEFQNWERSRSSARTKPRFPSKAAASFRFPQRLLGLDIWRPKLGASVIGRLNAILSAAKVSN